MDEVMDELEAIKQRVREMAISHPPEPWKVVGTVEIGGITEVGFAEDAELLLALSGHDRQVIDCKSGRRLARDTSTEHRSAWYGSHDLVGNGFGPLHGRRIALAGTVGGGLPLFTRDGWVATRMPIDWPDEHLLLLAPFNSIFQPTAQFWKLATLREPLAFGFSFSGQTLVVVRAEDITLYSRS